MSGRLKKVISIGAALAGVFLMLGAGGGVESGFISVSAAFIEMVIGCLLILFGAAGYLE